MVMPEIPSDLVDEILSWVPATSLKRFRSTCKRWNDLFKDQRFREKHFRRAPKQHRLLMLKEFRIFRVSVDLYVVPPSIEFKASLKLKNSHSNNSKQVGIAQVFHCDGLLLCITGDDKPVVWNPCLGDTRWIQHKNGYVRDCMFALGYENNQSCRSYKILMVELRKSDGFEMYEFSSNSWRSVDAPNFVRRRYRGVTLKGNTYWISPDDDCLLCFDFTRERFRHLCLPSSLNRLDYMALSVAREEQLSVLSYKNESGLAELEMWVTKNIDTEAKLSWSKLFAMGLNVNDPHLPFTSLLIDEEKKVALGCDSGNGYSRNKSMVYTIAEDDAYYTETPYFKKPPLWQHSWWPLIFNYVPSLISCSSPS